MLKLLVPPVTVPFEVLPSPQVMAAVKNEVVALVLLSVKVATTPLKGTPSVGVMVVPLVVRSSTTLAVLVAVTVCAATAALLPSLSVIWTLTV